MEFKEGFEESFKGTKFKTILVGKELPATHNYVELVSWCKKFGELGLAPRHAYKNCFRSDGNLSFRSRNGFVITGSGVDLNNACEGDFIKIVFCDFRSRIVHAIGLKEPSSETFLHYCIYRSRPDVNAVFHGHSQKILAAAEKLGLIQTRQDIPYGSIELAQEVGSEARKTDFVVIRNHGFVSIGKTMREAGERAVNVLEEAQQA